jgi:WD40 repeat protein
MIAADKLIKLWNSRTGEFVQNFEGHTKGISDIAWSSSSDLLASGSDDKTVRLWNVDTVEPPIGRINSRLNVSKYCEDIQVMYSVSASIQPQTS